MLRRHHISHSTNKPHVCPIEGCGKTYPYKIGVSRHLRTFHQVDIPDRRCAINKHIPVDAFVASHTSLDGGLPHAFPLEKVSRPANKKPANPLSAQLHQISGRLPPAMPSAPFMPMFYPSFFPNIPPMTQLPMQMSTTSMSASTGTPETSPNRPGSPTFSNVSPMATPPQNFPFFNVPMFGYPSFLPMPPVAGQPMQVPQMFTNTLPFPGVASFQPNSATQGKQGFQDLHGLSQAAQMRS